MFLVVLDIPLYNLCHLYYNNKGIQNSLQLNIFRYYFLYSRITAGVKIYEERQCNTMNNTMVRIFSHSFISYVNIDIALRQDTRSGRLIY